MSIKSDEERHTQKKASFNSPSLCCLFFAARFFSSAFVPSLSYSLYSMAWHGIQNNQPAIEDDVSTNI